MLLGGRLVLEQRLTVGELTSFTIYTLLVAVSLAAGSEAGFAFDVTVAPDAADLERPDVAPSDKVNVALIGAGGQPSAVASSISRPSGSLK